MTARSKLRGRRGSCIPVPTADQNRLNRDYTSAPSTGRFELTRKEPACNWLMLIFLLFLALAIDRGAGEECIYFPNCAQINPDKHPEYRVLSFDESHDGEETFLLSKERNLSRILKSGEAIPVEGIPLSFRARLACTAVLYLDGKLIFTKEVELGESVSVTLTNIDVDSNSSIALYLRAILPGSAGSTFESSKLNISIVVAPDHGFVNQPFLKESDGGIPVSTHDLCSDPLGEVSIENGGEWRGDWYFPHRCRLQRFSASGARQCLSNRTLLFAGDSMVRHIFVGAASILEEGVDLGATRAGDVLHIEEGTSAAEAADIRQRCSRRMRYVNHIFCEGRIRTRFDLDGGGRLDYFGVWGFRHRNALLRELYRRIDASRPPALLVLGVGSHELASVRRAGTADECPEECVCGGGLRDWFDTLGAVLEGDALLRRVPAVMVLPAAQNEALKPPDYAWQTNDLVLLFNARAAAALEAGSGGGRGQGGRVRVFDPFWMTAGRGDDSVDSVHYGEGTNAMLAQILLNHFCPTASQT